MFRMAGFSLLVVVFYMYVQSEAYFKNGIFRMVSEFSNKLITTQTNVIDTKWNITSVSWCAVLCFNDKKCGSFFFLADTNICQMHAVLFMNANDADDRPGSVYFEVTEDWCPRDKGYVIHRPLAICYKAHMEELDQTQAKSACSTEGASLAVVKDETTFNHMYDFLRASSNLKLTHFQIGVDDIDVEGQMKWADGTLATWTNWADGEPSHSAERCTAMAWFYYFKWNDIPCTHPISFLCQITKE